MNKLMGFFELKDSSLPSVPWKQFTPNIILNKDILWTIRTAVEKGDDLNLPRAVGVTAEDAYKTALEIYNKINNNGMVIYYPYFIAKKSGTLEVNTSRIVIEAVNNDLWNLVTYNKRNVTIIKTNNGIECDGEKEFLSDKELDELFNYANRIKQIFRNTLYESKSILLEWSYANNTDISKQPIGDNYLVFYEIRTL